jgi:hypothetical protein
MRRNRVVCPPRWRRRAPRSPAARRRRARRASTSEYERCLGYVSVRPLVLNSDDETGSTEAGARRSAAVLPPADGTPPTFRCASKVALLRSPVRQPALDPSSGGRTPPLAPVPRGTDESAGQEAGGGREPTARAQSRELSSGFLNGSTRPAGPLGEVTGSPSGTRCPATSGRRDCRSRPLHFEQTGLPVRGGCWPGRSQVTTSAPDALMGPAWRATSGHGSFGCQPRHCNACAGSASLAARTGRATAAGG